MKKSFNVLAFLRSNEVATNGFDGLDDFSADDMYSQAVGGGVEMTKQATPYQITVTNTTTTSKKLILFGSYKYLLEPNFGSDSGLTVSPSQANVSYSQLIQQVAQQPFDTSLIRIQSQNSSQITQILNINKQNANGQLFTEPLITQNYFSAYQQQSGILDINYNMTIDGSTWIQTTVLGTSDSNIVTYTFFPASTINLARPLVGKKPQVMYATPSVPTAVALVGGRNNSL